MKNKIFKRFISLLMVSSLIGVPCTSFAANSELELYPDAVYTIPAEELDSDGKWIYRELAKDGGFEEGYWNGNASVDSSGLDSTVKHSGNTSFKQTVSAQYKRMGVELDAALEANAKYRISYYVNPNRTVVKLIDRLVYSYPKPTNPSLNNLEDRTENKTVNLVANTWNFAAYTRTFTGGNNFGNAVSPHYSAFSYDTNDFATEGALTMYLDDYSVRRDVPDTFPSSYTKSITVKNAEGQDKQGADAMLSGDKIIFNFSLDIDYRSVTKENILVNGAPNDGEIEAVEVSVDEATRESRVIVTLGTLNADSDYEITLAKIMDAWGRKVKGAKSFSFTSAPLINTELVFKKDGVILEEITTGNIEVYLNLSSNLESVNAQLIAAVCSGNKFTHVEPKNVTIAKLSDAAGLSTTPDFTLSVAEGQTIRFYIWAEGEYPYPLTSVRTFSGNGLTKSEY